MLRRGTCLTAILLAGSFVTGCANQKAPAEAALKVAEQALDATKAEAIKYVPNEVKDAQTAMDAAKASLAKGDYEAALASAQALPARITALQAAAAAKKAELTQSWTALSAGLPQVVQAIQSRIEVLSKAKSLPAGLDPGKFDAAKAGLAAITETWGAATVAAGSGEIAEAVAKAKVVKGKAVEVLTALGMAVPPALQ